MYYERKMLLESRKNVIVLSTTLFKPYVKYALNNRKNKCSRIELFNELMHIKVRRRPGCTCTK